MPHKAQTIVCSICSREKNKDQKPLPARERYVGSHIKLVESIALEQGAQFFILSGKFGLLHAQERIEPYNFLLTEEGVKFLAARVFRQIVRLSFPVSEIQFYTKNKPNWLPYKKVIEDAAAKTNTNLRVVYLLPDA